MAPSASPLPRPAVRGLAARTRGLRWALAVLLAVVALAAAASGWVEVCSASGTCRPPAAGDAVTLGFALVVLLLLAPDLGEASLGGLLTVKAVRDQEERLSGVEAALASAQAQLAHSSAVAGGAVVNLVSGAATSAFAVDPPVPAPRVPPAALTLVLRDQSRYLAAELLLRHLGDLGSGLLEPFNLRLYLPGNEGEVLLPVLHEEGTRAEEDVFSPGEGAVGLAWLRRRCVVLEGDEVAASVAAMPPHRRARYAKLRAVAALPVLDVGGRPVGVLSASTRDERAGLELPDVLEELAAAAEVAARVLVDLLGWAEDRLPSLPLADPEPRSTAPGGPR